MKSLQELKEAIATGQDLYWNDPDPIPENDYKITWIEPITPELEEDFDQDYPILIQYANGASEAQVYLHEIITLK